MATPSTTYADLSDIIKHTTDVNAWLECYERLNTEGKLAALMFCCQYCRGHGLSLPGLICKHWELRIMWLEQTITTVTAAVVASFYADIYEGGAA